MIGKLNLCEAGSLLSRASVYIGPDSVITHMAAALEIPTVALYGPTNPVVWGKWHKDHLISKNPFIKKVLKTSKMFFSFKVRKIAAPVMKKATNDTLKV